MKSSAIASDEIKSDFITSRKRDFIAWRFHPCNGFLPPCHLRASSACSAAEIRTVITNHARGVYIIKTEFCISPTQRVVYHQVADECKIKRDEIQTKV